MPNIIKGSVADTLYIQFSESPITHSVELHPDIILDLGESGAVIGIDFQNIAQLLTEIPATPIATPTNPASDQFPEIPEPGRLIYIPA